MYQDSLMHTEGPEISCRSLQWLRTQTVMNMRFKRILYFLPVQGPLEWATGVLQLELRVLTHYFGPSVIRKIVPQILHEWAGWPKRRLFWMKIRFKHLCLKKLFPGEMFPSHLYIPWRDVRVNYWEGVSSWRVLNTFTQFVNNEKAVFYIHGENKIPISESHCHPKIFVWSTKWPMLL